MDFDKWIEVGKSFGLSGGELLGFVQKKEQECLEREERAEEREAARKAKELEIEIRREEAAIRKDEQEREAAMKREEQEREAAIRQGEQEREIEILRLRAEAEAAVAHPAQPDIGVRALRPKLPKFDETKDDIDAYLERFERFAVSQAWQNDTWAVSLSPLLTGKGLEVYASMPPGQANDYEQLKRAVLKRYQLTEDGFRVKFRETKPQKEETVAQYIARQRRYLVRWVDMSEIVQDFNSVCDLMLREQFTAMCSPDLAMFLKERVPRNIDEVARLAEQYVEAHGGSIFGTKTTRGVTTQHGAPVPTPSSDVRQQKPKIICYVCHKEGHLARDCIKNKQNLAYGYQGNDRYYNNGRPQPWIRSPQNWRSPDTKPSTKSGASCQWSEPESSIEDCIKDGQLQLANGQSVSYAGVLCNDRSMEKGLPLCEGYVGDQRVEVLRDTGCNTAAVKRELVKDEQLNGKKNSCVLIDGTIRQFPLAKIEVDTPYFTGTVEAMVMDNPIHDLILGNVPDIKSMVDDTWQAHSNSKAAAVQTRAQVDKEKKSIKPLVVPDVKVAEIDVAKLQEEQKSDEGLVKLWDYASEKKVFNTKNGNTYQYVIKKDILYRIYSQNRIGTVEDVKQIVVPATLRSRIMELAHESIVGGHLGTKKTSDRITSSFHWPGIEQDVSRFCKSCDICQKTIPKGRVTKVPLGEMPLMDAPFDRIAIDLIGPIAPVSENGNRYILTVVDYATRYPEAVALKRIETERVAEALLEIFSRVGFPKEILSDRGTQFTSEVMQEVTRLVSIKQLFTTPYNPKCNGLCERINGVLKTMLRKMCQERPKDWDRYLPAVLFAYREVPQSSTGFSPFELLYGRTVRGPMQVLKELWTEADTPETKITYQYVFDLRNRLEETCQIARESLLQARDVYKHHYDKKTKDRKFNVGELVTVLLPTDHNKLLLQWKGPYRVIEVINRMDYKIDMDGKIKVFHANLLKLYTPRQPDHAGEEENEEVPDAVAASIAVIEPNEDNDEGIIDDESLLQFAEFTKHETIEDVNINPDLSNEQRQQIRELLEEYTDIFTEKPGATNLVEHKVELTTTEPIRVKPYPIPYAKRKDIDNEVQKMLQAGIIELSNSNYNSPIVLVKKKDHTNRFCIDFRRLNTVTKFDAEPMGSTDDIMTKLCRDKFFTKIDLSKGYWQIQMEESSKPMTSFSTPNGCYQFRMMPFGMVNSGASFNRMMRILLDGCEDIDNYVDDVLCHTEEWTRHIDALKDVFQRIREAGLTIRPSKCFVGYSNIDFTGHIVGQGELRMEDDKLEKIKAAPPPATKKQVRAFLGMAGYYRKFIPNFAVIAAPLTDLTKKGEPNKVVWGRSQGRAFKTLKDLLTSAPILRLPDLSRQFILRTDASDIGVGAVLLQQHVDGVFPVAYASKKLLKREQNYPIMERECLAIVYGVKKFQKYLYGTEFIIETDHSPLTYLRKSKTDSGRLMRWALFLQNYRFNIKAIKGSDNVGADYLSRQ